MKHMTKKPTLYRILCICMIMFIASSCTHSMRNANTSENSAPPPEQLPNLDQPDTKFSPPEVSVSSIEDESAQIDEVKVRGQTQSIEVKPRGSMPAYEVVPQDAAHPNDNAAGRSRWRVLSF